MLLLALTPLASASELSFVCTPDDGGPIVGLPGVVVNCVAEPPADGTFDEVSWLWGDGATATGLAVSHTYDDVGQYTVSARLEGWVPGDTADTGDADVPEAVAGGLVTVCGPPAPQFTYVDMGGLDFRLENGTPPEPGCVQDLLWEVFEGPERSGEPFATFDLWEPRIVFPDEGQYTVVLTVGGLAGTEATATTIDARYGLPDAFTGWSGCATGPGAGAAGLVGVALLVLGRRATGGTIRR